MNELGRVLATMVEEHRQLPLRIELVSEYDKSFLTQTVIPAVGASQALLGKPRKGLARLARRPHEGSSEIAHVSFSRTRLELRDAEHWRYEELDESGRVIRVVGFNGEECWTHNGSKLSVWPPGPPESPLDYQESMWQAHASLALRSVVESSLVISAIRIQRVSSITGPFGEATRLDVVPRYATESPLVSAWAERCQIDVDDVSGIIVLVINVDSNGTVLSRHSVTSLGQGAALGLDRFEPDVSAD